MNKIPEWRKHLRTSLSELARLGSTDDDIRMHNLTRLLQKTYPGNYVLEEFYNPEIQNWDYRLKFDSPEDHTAFVLRYE